MGDLLHSCYTSSLIAEPLHLHKQRTRSNAPWAICYRDKPPCLFVYVCVRMCVCVCVSPSSQNYDPSLNVQHFGEELRRLSRTTQGRAHLGRMSLTRNLSGMSLRETELGRPTIGSPSRASSLVLRPGGGSFDTERGMPGGSPGSVRMMGSRDSTLNDLLRLIYPMSPGNTFVGSRVGSQADVRPPSLT